MKPLTPRISTRVRRGARPDSAPRSTEPSTRPSSSASCGPLRNRPLSLRWPDVITSESSPQAMRSGSTLITRPGAWPSLPLATSALQTISLCSPTSQNAPGYGWVTARTRLNSSSAGFFQTSLPSAGVRRPNTVALDSSWTVSVRRPWISGGRVSRSRLAAASRSLPCRVKAVSVRSMATGCWATMAPASARLTMRCRVTPVSVSPLTSTQLAGARPRYAGRSEPCRLNAPLPAVASRASLSRLR
ncbi:hypothetical protein D3C81_1432400 [compost metagenome]